MGKIRTCDSSVIFQSSSFNSLVCLLHFAAAFASFAVSRLRDRLPVRFRHTERVRRSESGWRWWACARRSHLRTRLHYPVAHAAGSPSAVLVHLLPCSRVPLFLHPPERPRHCGNPNRLLPKAISSRFSRVFLRKCTMNTANTPDNKSPEAARLERVWLSIGTMCNKSVEQADCEGGPFRGRSSPTKARRHGKYGQQMAATFARNARLQTLPAQRVAPRAMLEKNRPRTSMAPMRAAE